MDNALAAAIRRINLVPAVRCPYCEEKAELVGGDIIYPRRPDLYNKKFWLCHLCGAYVGCHAPNPRLGFVGTEPLGRLANTRLRIEKCNAHDAFDPIWKDGHMTRTQAYAWLARELELPITECHMGEFDVGECAAVVRACKEYWLTVRDLTPMNQR